MKRVIETYDALYHCVDRDEKDHKIKARARLFLDAMMDWPSFNQESIAVFISELKNYFGTPLTADAINNKKIRMYVDHVGWKHEAGSSIAAMIEMSTRFFQESDFDKIVLNILNYYEEE